MMPPGTQSAIISSQISAANNSAAHLAAQGAIGAYRNAALLELADRLLGRFTESVITILRVQTAVHQILISAVQQRHAIEGRKISAQGDADLVASRLTEAVQHLHYQRLPQRRPEVFELLGYVPTCKKYILIAIKLVRSQNAATRVDEWWVQTAFPFGKRKLKEALRKNKLFDLRSGVLATELSK